VNVSNPRTQARKGLISYYETNGITYLKKHVHVNHYLISKTFEKEVQNMMRGSVERLLAKKHFNPFGFSIFKKIIVKDF
jgi:hypothetical protein